MTWCDIYKLADHGAIWYNYAMSTVERSLFDVMPSATPSPAEIAAWDALSRDEQLRRLRASFEDPDCSRVSTMSMAEILESALAKSKHE